MSPIAFRRNPWRTRSDDPSSRACTAGFTDTAVAAARRYHRALDGYVPTPLHRLPGLAAELGVAEVTVKDESRRFGLAAFKVLGAGYAIHRLVERGKREFVTATDGNHGRAVAWAASEVGGRAVIYLPGAASPAREAALADLGAEVRRVTGTYDDAVAAARDAAAAERLSLVQDMAWPGYEEVPRWIMQGYTTLIDETLEQIGGHLPTHLLLPCGVGSFAAAVIGRLVERTDGAPPACVLIEPASAACASAAFESGAAEPPLLSGDTHSFMACLSCGQLSSGAWPILRAWAHSVAAIPDELARRGMRRAATPAASDPSIESGESGAVGFGLLDYLAQEDLSQGGGTLADGLGLTSDSRVLVISTEGATDRQVYDSVVTGGVR